MAGSGHGIAELTMGNDYSRVGASIKKGGQLRISSPPLQIY
jgi:hypothetical protein